MVKDLGLRDCDLDPSSMKIFRTVMSLARGKASVGLSKA